MRSRGAGAELCRAALCCGCGLCALVCVATRRPTTAGTDRRGRTRLAAQRRGEQLPAVLALGRLRPAPLPRGAHQRLHAGRRGGHALLHREGLPVPHGRLVRPARRYSVQLLKGAHGVLADLACLGLDAARAWAAS
eukprot:scaffold1779_cov373-Prasinococcus_capsulatus_cf.AAC.4